MWHVLLICVIMASFLRNPTMCLTEVVTEMTCSLVSKVVTSTSVDEIRQGFVTLPNTCSKTESDIYRLFELTSH